MGAVSKHETSNQLAIKLAEAAKAKMKNQECETPFKKRCKKYYGVNWKGGKPDDVSCVVAWVSKKVRLQSIRK